MIRLARRAAAASIVLLKNDGVAAAVAQAADARGHRADRRRSHVPARQLLRYARSTGNDSAGHPARRSVRTRACFIHAARTWSKVAKNRAPHPSIEAAYLRPGAGSAEHGLKGEYFRSRDFSGAAGAHATRYARRLSLGSRRPADDLVARGELAARTRARVAMTSACAGPGNCCRPFPGATRLSVGANDGFRLFLDGRQLMEDWEINQRVQSRSAFVNLEAGKALRPQARVLRGHPRRRSAARVAFAGRQGRRSTKRSKQRARPTRSSLSVASPATSKAKK